MIGLIYTIDNWYKPPTHLLTNRNKIQVNRKKKRRDESVNLSIKRMSTIPNDFINFLVPVIQEFDGVVEQVRYVNSFSHHFKILYFLI